MNTPLTLVFETSTPAASIGLAAADGSFDERSFESDRHHNAALFEPLSGLLEGHDANAIGLVLVGSGPGSYSGTRVGIAAAQGIAMAAPCPAVAVPSILAVPSAIEGGRCLVIGDARRGSYWFAEIETRRLVRAPQVTDEEGLRDVVAAHVAENLPVISFEGAERLPLPAMEKAAVRVEAPSAARLWRAWQASEPAQREAWSAEPPQPIYLKPPHITPAKRSWLVRP